MTDKPTPDSIAPMVILVVDSDPEAGPALATALAEILGGHARVELVVDGPAAAAASRANTDASTLLPVVFIDGDSEETSRTAIELNDLPELRRSRNVLVTSSPSLGGVDLALRRGAVNGMITRPWTPEGLRAQLTANLATFLVEHAPERMSEFDTLLDDDATDRAERRLAERNAASTSLTPSTPLLLDASISDEEVEQRMLRVLDRALGHPPRIRVAAGTVMIESGDDVGGIYILLEGTVKLSSRTPTGERILHHQSTGGIIGLLSLASHRRAMLQCRALTDVRAVPITLTQLAQALESEPELSSLLNRVLITSLASRLRRSDELQVELDRSLSELSEARAQLVAAARFAALGELAAGMAHELNNPTAALVRSAEHLRTDLSSLIVQPEIRAVIDRRVTEQAPLPSSQRALRRRLIDEGIDPSMAGRLIDAGFVDIDEALAVQRLPAPDAKRAEVASHLGGSLRAVTSAAEQIQSLVTSLRAYLRNEDGRGPVVADVDVASTIDDALRLVSHRLREVETTKRFTPVPDITGRPGALQQVWTNLVTNALDAMEGSLGEPGRSPAERHLEIVLAEGSGETVEVHVIDNGPGIPSELLERIFEPRFTTKHGRVEFGLGLGLSISRQIVEEHGGQISVESERGRTDMSVVLPVEGPS
jgi:signal transduction histidine kinase